MCHLVLDDALIATERVKVDRPYYFGKHRMHGVNIQTTAAPRARSSGPPAPHRAASMTCPRLGSQASCVPDQAGIRTLADKGYQEAGGAVIMSEALSSSGGLVVLRDGEGRAQLPAFWGQQRSLRRMRQLLSWAWAPSPGTLSRAWERLAAFWEAGLLRPLYGVATRPSAPWYPCQHKHASLR